MNSLPNSSSSVSNLDVIQKHNLFHFETHFIALSISITLFFSTLCAHADSLKVNEDLLSVHADRVKELDSTLNSSKTVGQFLNQIKSKLSPRAYAFLKSEIKGQEHLKLSMSEKRIDGTIVLTVDQLVIPFRVERKGPHLVATLNNRSFELAAGMPIESIWSNFMNALPNKNKSLLEFFLPQAHALALELAAVGIAAIWAGYVMALDISITCDMYKKYVTACQKNNLNEDRVNSFALFDRDWSKSALLCKKSSHHLRDCLINTTKTMADYSPPHELKTYFNLPDTKHASAHAER